MAETVLLINLISNLPNSVFIYFSGCASKQFPIALWTIFKKRRRPVRSCWCLLFFDIYVYVMYTRQWRRKSLYQKLLFAWLRTFWQMLLHFYDRIVTQVMYKNMYITTLLPAIQLAFEKCSVFLIEIRNLAIWWLRYHPKLYIPSTLETQMNLVPFCWADWPIKMSKIQARTLDVTRCPGH